MLRMKCRRSVETSILIIVITLASFSFFGEQTKPVDSWTGVHSSFRDKVIETLEDNGQGAVASYLESKPTLLDNLESGCTEIDQKAFNADGNMRYFFFGKDFKIRIKILWWWLKLTFSLKVKLRSNYPVGVGEYVARLATMEQFGYHPWLSSDFWKAIKELLTSSVDEGTFEKFVEQYRKVRGTIPFIMGLSVYNVRAANFACQDYFERAVDEWKAENHEEAMLWLGRAVHMIQDTLIPFHAWDLAFYFRFLNPSGLFPWSWWNLIKYAAKLALFLLHGYTYCEFCDRADQLWSQGDFKGESLPMLGYDCNLEPFWWVFWTSLTGLLLTPYFYIAYLSDTLWDALAKGLAKMATQASAEFIAYFFRRVNPDEVWRPPEEREHPPIRPPVFALDMNMSSPMDGGIYSYGGQMGIGVPYRWTDYSDPQRPQVKAVKLDFVYWPTGTPAFPWLQRERYIGNATFVLTEFETGATTYLYDWLIPLDLPEKGVQGYVLASAYADIGGKETLVGQAKSGGVYIYRSGVDPSTLMPSIEIIWPEYEPPGEIPQWDEIPNYDLNQVLTIKWDAKYPGGCIPSVDIFAVIAKENLTAPFAGVYTNCTILPIELGFPNTGVYKWQIPKTAEYPTEILTENTDGGIEWHNKSIDLGNSLVYFVVTGYPQMPPRNLTDGQPITNVTAVSDPIYITRNEIDPVPIVPHPPSVTVISPNGGEVCTGTQEVVWEASDPDDDPLLYHIYVESEDGTTHLLAQSLAGVNSLTFDTCTLRGGKYRIKVNATELTPYSLSAVDYSDDWFTITKPTTEFDFGISVTQSSQSVNRGEQATYQVTINPVSGSPQKVELETSSLPSDTSSRFEPSQGKPPFTSTLTITTSTSTPIGIHEFKIVGTCGELTHDAALTIDVKAPLCIIATTTYGSELAPEVQFLRDFRDSVVLSTFAGSHFMQVFNAWYYSFSPGVAIFIAQQPVAKTIMKGALYPLIGILHLSSMTHSAFASSPELGIVVTGFVASSLIGIVYFTIPATALLATVKRSKKKTLKTKQLKLLAVPWLISVTLIIIGEITLSPAIMMTATASFVLITLVSSAIVVANKIVQRFP